MDVQLSGAGGIARAEKQEADALPRFPAALAVVRVAWIAVALACLALLLASAPARIHELLDSPEAVQMALARVRLPIGWYAALAFLVDAVYVFGSTALALLIYRRRPHDWTALLVAWFLVTFSASLSPTLAASAHHSQFVALYVVLLGAVGYASLNALFYLFPDGRFVPSWT